MKMSRVVLAIALLLTAAPPVRGHDEIARTPIEESLSGIDFLPDHATLSTILSGDLTALIAVANDDDETLSPGVRIRAFRSLGLFDDDIARAALTTAINRYRNSDTPIEQLYLIAALEALGDIGGQADVQTISDSLSHDRRDVRAAAARALGKTLEQSACSPLQTQRARETEAQVRLTVDAALHDLGSLCSFGVE
jgi:HEAT repeat protein